MLFFINFKQKFRPQERERWLKREYVCIMEVTLLHANIEVFSEDPSITHTWVEYINFPILPLWSFQKRQITSIPYSYYYYI